jgi:hypothetical protein
MFTLLFPSVVTETATFNSAGFIGWSGNEVESMGSESLIFENS